MPNFTAQLKRDGHLLAKVPPAKKQVKLIPKMSEKRAKQMREYAKLRKELLEASPWCMAWRPIHGWFMDNGLPGFRRERSTELHHARGRIGEMLLDRRYLWPVSRNMHNWIHAHPKEARALGLLA